MNLFLCITYHNFESYRSTHFKNYTDSYKLGSCHLCRNEFKTSLLNLLHVFSFVSDYDNEYKTKKNKNQTGLKVLNQWQVLTQTCMYFKIYNI